MMVRASRPPQPPCSETVREYVIGILGGGKPQRCHPGVDNSIQHGIEFAVKDQEDAQHRQPLQGLFDQRGHQGAGCDVGGKIRAGENVNPQTQGGVDKKGAAGGHHRAPHEDAPQKQQRLLFVAVQPVEDMAKSNDDPKPTSPETINPMELLLNELTTTLHRPQDSGVVTTVILFLFKNQAGTLDAGGFQWDAERVQQLLGAAGGTDPGSQAHENLHGLPVICSHGSWD